MFTFCSRASRYGPRRTGSFRKRAADVRSCGEFPYLRTRPSIVGMCDIVFAALVNPEFSRRHWLKPVSVVVDAGYNPGNVGDVAFDEAVERAALITPVPGGAAMHLGRLGGARDSPTPASPSITSEHETG